MSTDVSYRYDPTRFREVFEHRFSYIGGVQRNSRSVRVAAGPARPRQWSPLDLRGAVGSTAAGWPQGCHGRREQRRRHRLRPAERTRVRAPVARRPAPRRDRRADQLPARRGRGGPCARRQPPAGVHLRREPGGRRGRCDRARLAHARDRRARRPRGQARHSHPPDGTAVRGAAGRATTADSQT